MYDTILNRQIQLLGEMSEELADANLNRTMPGWQKNDLARDFCRLNAQVAQKKRVPPTKPTDEESWWWTTNFGIMTGILSVIIVITLVVSIVGRVMLSVGAS